MYKQCVKRVDASSCYNTAHGLQKYKNAIDTRLWPEQIGWRHFHNVGTFACINVCAYALNKQAKYSNIFPHWTYKYN